MANDGSPPSSWYDPPTPKFELEIKRERPADAGDKCERYACREDAVMIVEIGDVKYPNGSSIIVCKNHYEDITEDTIEEIESHELEFEED